MLSAGELRSLQGLLVITSHLRGPGCLQSAVPPSLWNGLISTPLGSLILNRYQNPDISTMISSPTDQIGSAS